MHGEHFQQSMDRPGMVTNFARGQLNKGKMNISLSPFASAENLLSRDGFGRPVPRQPAHCHTQAESDWLALTYGIPLVLNDGVHIYDQPSSGQPLLELIGSSTCFPVAFTAESLPAQGQYPQGNSNNGCCLLKLHHGHFFYSPIFSHTLYWCM